MTIETSLSRVWQHINSDSTFAVISAYLADDDDALNHKELANDIRSIGLRFIELSSEYSSTTADGEVFSSEKSYMVPGITKKQAMKLAEKYDQRFILWKDSDEFVLLGTRRDVGIGEVYINFKNNKKSLTFNKSTVKAAFSAFRKGSESQVGKKLAFVSELRIKDFPTSYIYQREGVSDEWIRII